MLTALIREAECIGCNRCVAACPVDAIVGAPKQLHSILTEDCIGCKLCLSPCPVDCIDILPLDQVKPLALLDKRLRAQRAKRLHLRRRLRLAKQAPLALPSYRDQLERKQTIQSEIQAALARVASKRNGQ